MAVLGLRLWGAKNVTAPRIASPGNEESRGVFLFERGTLAGHRFTFEAAVCPNPTCECDYITLRCSPDPPEPQTESSGPISIDLDLARRKIANLAELKREPASADLARAIASEIDDERWHQLMLLYEHLKEYWTEHTDWDHFDELCTFFPEGTMAGYREILPYAKRLTFNRGEARWLAVDSYCFNPTCPCREAALYFVLLPETQGQRPREILSVFYDYKNATTHAPEHVNDYQISEQELVASVKQAYTNLDSLLAERHLLLKMLYSRTHVVPREHSKLKIGRNEPCPCGSGKKYKKCCGA